MDPIKEIYKRFRYLDDGQMLKNVPPRNQEHYVLLELWRAIKEHIDEKPTE